MVSHGTGFDRHTGKISDHDTAGFGLPEGVVEGLAKRLLRPENGLGIEWLAYACQVAEAGVVMPAHDFGAFLHQQPDRRRRRIPNRNPVLLDELVPSFRVETGIEHDLRRAVRPGADDAVRRAGDPSRIGV